MMIFNSQSLAELFLKQSLNFGNARVNACADLPV